MTIVGVSHTAVLFYLSTAMSCYVWAIVGKLTTFQLTFSYYHIKLFSFQTTDMKSADKACHFLLSMAWCHSRKADAHM